MVGSFPRLALGAERGGAGKTTLSLGLLAAWRRRGRECAAFKKGPDYIDAAWLSMAAGRPCRNLDTYLMGEETVARSFADRALASGVNLIEGNRGLFDGVDSEGSFSTAELAKLLDCPVVIVIDCTKQTRTAAAVALGCRLLDKDVRVAGVILNRLGTARQEGVTRAAVETGAGLPVLGAVPKLDKPAFYERRLGLLPPQEDDGAAEAVDSAARVAEDYLDVEGLWRLAREAGPLSLRFESAAPPDRAPRGHPRIGYFHDRAFHFYYPENLEALERLGADLVAIDALHDAALPDDVDGLYIGGGFPEQSAGALAANGSMRSSVKAAAEGGLPIYAECGGLIYLGQRLQTDDGVYAMAGVFPVSFVLEERPQGHGYAEAVATAAHPFLPAGTRMKGHEFHYTRVVDGLAGEASFALRFERGRGLADGRDGLVYRNTLATYLHVHALGETAWAPAVLEACLKYRRMATGAMGVGSGNLAS